jgi:hypothetical protein
MMFLCLFALFEMILFCYVQTRQHHNVEIYTCIGIFSLVIIIRSRARHGSTNSL